MGESKAALERQQVHRRYNFVKIWQRRYAHMKARQEGRASHQTAGALGKPICTPKEFEEWCTDWVNLERFITLYYDWVISGFTRWTSPSIDRVDPTKGYTTDNLQWLSFEENCIKNNKDPMQYMGKDFY